MMTRKDNIERRKDRLAARRANLSAEKQAVLVEFLQSGPTEDSVPAVIPPRPEGEPIPLSFAQERLWVWDQLNPGNPAYNISLAAQISGLLNLPGMNQGLNEIINRHESLRTNFARIDGHAVQVIAPMQAVELPIVDLGGLAEREWEAEARRLAAEDARRPFNLAEGSLLRITFLKRNAQYAVIRTVPHIISDLWSWGIFIREIVTLYRAYCAGEPSPLPEMPLQYADYSHWQRQWLKGEVLEAELGYWKRQLADLQVLSLPTDRPRPAVRTYNGASKGLTLPTELTEQLRTLSQQESATLFITLLAALKILLSRYSGQEDIVVGTLLAGRSRFETEGLIGFFINTLVMRSKLSNDPSIRDVIHHVREVVLGAQAHQDIPFEKLIEELKPERSLSHAPMFQVMFSMSNTPSAAREETGASSFTDLSFSGLGGRQHEIRLDDAKFDLTVTMAEMADTIGVSFEYNTDLFDGTTVGRMVRNYTVLLERMVTHPNQSLSALQMLSESEQHQALVEWNQTEFDYQLDGFIHESFETQAERTPDAVAIDDEYRQLTYRELNSRANQIAGYLRRVGVATESIVGIALERSADLIAGLLGILKAGGAYLPLDPLQPRDRLAFIMKDSGAEFLLTLRRLADRIPGGEAKLVCLDTDWETISKESADNLKVETSGDNAAYVIYTSGSTGKPKGVVGSQSASLNRFRWMWERYPFKEDDICCQKTTISFVDSIWEIFGPMLKGVRVSIISDDTVREPARLIGALRDRQVTRIVLVPSLLRMLFESGKDLGAEIPGLKIWVTSGEYLSPEMAKSFFSWLPGSQLLNLYGSSEVAADATFFELSSWPGDRASVPIGSPVYNIRIYLLDRNKRPVLLGAHGELHAGGAGLARGYLGRPDLTAERFIPDHVGGVAGARLYNTGDIARHLPDGNLDFLGRIDSQVKIRGFRIEVGEVEVALDQHPDVEQSAVIARESGPSDKKLTAYVIPLPNSAPTGSHLRSYLKQRLPDYMVPAEFLILGSMPLTSSGKVDRIALARLDPGLPEDQREYVAPRDLLEMQLAQIWEKVLGVAPVGIKDNFFSLGGTSVSAVRLVAQIDRHFKQTLTLNVIMQEGNIANLARLLSEKGGPPTYSTLAAFRRDGKQPPFFIVHSIGGEVLEFYNLARRLGNDQPFYGLQAPLGTEAVNENKSIEETATDYIRVIREVQPEGPYLLGGYSWGGVAAFEMAQQLARQNQEVALLAVFDTIPPTALRRAPRYVDESVFLSKMLRGFAVANEGHLSLSPDDLRLLDSDEQYKYALEYLKKLGVIDENVVEKTGEGYVRSYVRGHLARVKALCDYEPKVFPGKITLFRSEQEPAQEQGWGCLSTQPLNICEISGPHYAIMQEPQVQALAGQLKACISRATELHAQMGKS